MSESDDMHLLVMSGTADIWRRLFQGKVTKAWWRRFYNAYIVSAAWKVKQKACSARACGKCEVCRLCMAVQAHHLTYERIGDEAETDLQAVCVECHKKTHGKLLA